MDPTQYNKPASTHQCAANQQAASMLPMSWSVFRLTLVNALVKLTGVFLSQ